jgi:hypothetical protein
LRQAEKRIEFRSGFLAAQRGLFYGCTKLNKARLDETDFDLLPRSKACLQTQLRAEFIALAIDELRRFRLHDGGQVFVSEST